MKTTLLTVLALGVSACATPNDGKLRIGALEKELQGKDREIASLKQENASQQLADEKADDLSAANLALSQDLKDEIKKGNITIERLRDRLTVSVLQELLFDSGKAEVNGDGKKVLDRVVSVLQNVQNRMIMVEGHTDNIPIGSKIMEKFPTNWELSTARATMILRYLQEKGVDPQHLGAAGFSEYRPIVPNDTDANRQKNRRIDIVLSPEMRRKVAG
jgi:chemotaxis protein MotB